MFVDAVNGMYRWVLFSLMLMLFKQALERLALIDAQSTIGTLELQEACRLQLARARPPTRTRFPRMNNDQI